jgi:hypothetical protein
VVLARHQPDLRRLDAQGGVVRDQLDDARRAPGLAEGGGEDPVVRLGGVEAERTDGVEVEPVRLDLQRAAAGERHRRPDVTAVGDPQRLDAPEDLARRAADVVRPGLQGVELLHDREGDHRSGRREGEHRLGVRDEHRGVDHHPGRVADGRSEHRPTGGARRDGQEHVSTGPPRVRAQAPAVRSRSDEHEHWRPWLTEGPAPGADAHSDL